MKRLCRLLPLLLLLPPLPLFGQDFRLRVDTRLQAAAYRGAALDSVAISQVTVAAGGRLTSPGGFAVRCAPGAAYCTFFRPGPERHGGPVVTSVDFAIWRLGIPGLSLRGAGRLGIDLGEGHAWPGTDPALQLLDGYLEYAAARATVQLGRTHAVTRLGFQGFDGAAVDVRPFDRGLTISAYGGAGLARGVALPVTSPALNPLDDFQPRDRQLLVGGGVEWSNDLWQARAVYQREVDPGVDYFVSERVGFDAVVRLLSAVSVKGGADYDLAAEWWGSAEAALTVFAGRGRSLTVGARRYRPHFDLWTIWGAFSPVPYHAAYGSARARIVRGVDVRFRGEVYRFLDAEASTPLADVERDGWRWSAGLTCDRITDWAFDLDYHVEHGPGAASLGIEGGARWTPDSRVTLSAGAALLERPLEFRFDDARVWSIALRGAMRPTGRVRVHLGAQHHDELRRRPDAAQFDWSQLRFDAGVSLLFGGGDGVAGLHPAIRDMPAAGASR